MSISIESLTSHLPFNSKWPDLVNVWQRMSLVICTHQPLGNVEKGYTPKKEIVLAPLDLLTFQINKKRQHVIMKSSSHL